MSQTTIKIYAINNHFGPAEVRAFICEGCARDEMRRKRFYRDKNTYMDVNTLTLPDESLIKDGLTLYRKLEFDHMAGTDTGKYTAWHLDDSAAEADAKRMGLKPGGYDSNGEPLFHYQIAYLDIETIEPIQKEIQVMFNHGKSGFICRINAHPERDGHVPDNKAKIFVPDKKFPDPDIGPAIVSIAKELDNIGFLTGHMVRFDDAECPTMKEILDWAWDNDIQGDLITIKHPSRGTYYAIGTHTGPNRSYEVQQLRAMTLTQADTKRHIYKSSAYSDIVTHDYQEYTVTSIPFEQAIIEDVWGPGITMNDIDKMFIESKALSEMPDWNKSLKPHDENIEKAIRMGVIHAYWNTRHHVEAMSLNWPRAIMLLNFDLDTVRTMAETVKQLNEQADNMLANLKRKGKL